MMPCKNNILLSDDYVKRSLLDLINRIGYINISVENSFSTPFPKDRTRMPSFYEYKPGIKVTPDGEIIGGASGVICGLIDFSFIRTLVAPIYSVEGGHCFDPVSLFMLEFFVHLEGFFSRKALLEKLKDPVRGSLYREYTGISIDRTPSEVDLHNFKQHSAPQWYRDAKLGR